MGGVRRKTANEEEELERENFSNITIGGVSQRRTTSAGLERRDEDSVLIPVTMNPEEDQYFAVFIAVRGWRGVADVV